MLLRIDSLVSGLRSLAIILSFFVLLAILSKFLYPSSNRPLIIKTLGDSFNQQMLPTSDNPYKINYMSNIILHFQCPSKLRAILAIITAV